MTTWGSSPEERLRHAYSVAVEMIDECIRDREAHQADTPNCRSHPLCLGDASLRLSELSRINRTAFLTFTVAAICELADARKEIVELKASAFARAIDLAQANGELRDVADRLALVEAELTAWEESADAVYPADPA